MKRIIMIIAVVCLTACSANEEVPAIAKISGTWEIENIIYQVCTNSICKDGFTVDFENSGLTF